MPYAATPLFSIAAMLEMLIFLLYASYAIYASHTLMLPDAATPFAEITTLIYQLYDL